MRSIVVNTRVWKWQVGVSTAVIVSPQGRKTAVQAGLLTGRPLHGMVKPSHVRAYIETHLEKA